MDASAWYEVVGYVASGLILASLAMKSLLRLRVINLIGAVVFTVYGLLIAAPPVWVVNAAIAVIDVWYLRGMLSSDEHVEVLEVATDSAYLRRLLEFHAEDIAAFVPRFSGVRGDHRAFLVLRDVVPAAVVLVRLDGDLARVDLDYAVPAYRDHTSGAHVYGGELFARLGVTAIVADPGSPGHDRYLQRMGFTRTADGWRRELGRARG
jgi:hypothetical protein